MTRNHKTSDKISLNMDLDLWVAKISASVYKRWDAALKVLEASSNPHVQWITQAFLRKLSIEAPVIISFVFICVILHLFNCFLPSLSRWLGIRDAFHPFQPMQYLRLVTHIFGHENMAHLRGNMTHILLVGPSAEEIFGSKNMIYIMMAVALSSGFGHILLGPANTSQIGASGFVFALVLLNSLVSARVGRIPVSFVLTACLWVGDEISAILIVKDTISHSAHLIGAIVGTAAGYYIQSGKTAAELMGQTTQWNLFTTMTKTNKSA